jgi:Helix-turn-helix domain
VQEYLNSRHIRQGEVQSAALEGTGWMPIKKASEQFSISVAVLKRLIREGKIEHSQTGNAIFVQKESLRDYLQESGLL